jgi:hypothetical protein
MQCTFLSLMVSVRTSRTSIQLPFQYHALSQDRRIDIKALGDEVQYLTISYEVLVACGKLPYSAECLERSTDCRLLHCDSRSTQPNCDL